MIRGYCFLTCSLKHNGMKMLTNENCIPLNYGIGILQGVG